jgi:hypothetical protein
MAKLKKDFGHETKKLQSILEMRLKKIQNEPSMKQVYIT